MSRSAYCSYMGPHKREERGAERAGEVNTKIEARMMRGRSHKPRNACGFLEVKKTRK